MMNKAVLVGSPPLQEELLRPRRRQQPRQHPRPWEGTSSFFLIGGNGYITINNMCPKKASGHGVVFMSSLYQHYQGKSLHNYVMMPQYDFLYTIFLREDPSTHHRCISITPRIVLSYCIIIQGVYHKGAMTMSFFSFLVCLHLKFSQLICDYRLFCK